MNAGWRSRGYLPHLDVTGAVQFVTFRLHDSLPAHLVRGMRQGEDAGVDRYLDGGLGRCQLRDPQSAELVQDELLSGDGSIYALYAWTILPNHVHVLIRPEEEDLGTILKRWKGRSARRINELHGKEGRLWAREWYDRYTRDDEHFANVVGYIDRNPVKAGLRATAEEWPFGSASRRPNADTQPAD